VLICWIGISLANAAADKPGSPKKETPPQSAAEPALTKDPAARRLSLSPEEQYLLLKLQIERDLQDNILKWAQTRFWSLAVVSVVVGFFGVRSLVRELISTELKDAMRASADASAAAAQGKDVVKEVRAEAAKYSAIVEELTTAARGVDKKFGELSSRIDAEGTRSVAAADLKVAAIDQQLGELRRMREMVLLALQAFQVLFLWVHDWIPLGRLNDVAAVRSQDTGRRLVTVTLIQSVPWTIGLCFSLLHFRRPYPD